MSLTIRRATPADVQTIIEFNRRLALESEGKTLEPGLLSRGVEAALADPAKGLYFLAEDGPEILGQMMVTFEWSDWRNGWFWWVQSVYVRAAARRRGVFRSLFNHVVQAARSSGQVIGLRLYVDRENEVAQNTYAQVGLQPTGYLVLEQYPLP